ncbi:MAG TPA: hypothetical protein VFG23_08430 [Polyangia bacterium]|nr:hypothetical protein [Polyangia bacterium]
MSALPLSGESERPRRKVKDALCHPTAESLRHAGKGCWYFTTTVACPVCAGGFVERERRYTPKPDDPAERYEYLEIYDWCMER